MPLKPSLNHTSQEVFPYSPLFASNLQFEAMTGDAITVGWAWGNDTRRTTFDILWSCMTIILVCAYKVMHLNLPSEEDTSAQWWHWPFWRMRVRKLKWMAIMALSPEIVLSQCVRDWLWARQSVRKFSSIDSQVLGQLQDSSSQVPVGSDTVTNLFRMSKQPRRPELLLFKYTSALVMVTKMANHNVIENGPSCKHITPICILEITIPQSTRITSPNFCPGVDFAFNLNRIFLRLHRQEICRPDNIHHFRCLLISYLN